MTRHSGRIVALAILSCCFLPALAQALPETKRINSIKSLTHTLSLVEKEHDGQARFFTMKLQIYLEDIYISQGTAGLLKPSAECGTPLDSGTTSRCSETSAP